MHRDARGEPCMTAVNLKRDGTETFTFTMSEEAAASIIVTKNADDFGVHNTAKGKDMLRIPAFAFLYLLGHAEKHGYHGME